MAIDYCDGRRLRRLFQAGSHHVSAHRAELDRINVFPIPDGDTGTNMALTLRSMADAVDGVRNASVSTVASQLAEAGLLAARGNSGMMMSHFFLGLAEGLGGLSRANPVQIATALRRASNSLYHAVDQPVEGTILTVVRECTEEAERFASSATGLVTMGLRMLEAAEASLARTPDLLPSLREAGVVDAGAKGFVRFLEGAVNLAQGRALSTATTQVETPFAAAAARFPEDVDRSFRYCTEFIARGSPLPERRELAEAVRSLGGSLIVTRASSIAKIHIHTDDPEPVEQALRALGCEATCVKLDDMRAQHGNLRRSSTRSLAVVTDSACDLPNALIIEHAITVVPLTVMFGDEVFLDQVDITHEEFLERLVDPGQPPPTTSQPSPAQFEKSFVRAAEQADEIIGIFVAGSLSGTLGQAKAVAARFSGAKIRVHDSRAASLGTGFQVLKAAELARDGCGVDDTVAELERVRGRSGLLLTVDTLKYLKRSGRVGKAKAFLGNLLDLKPVLSLDREGTVVPVERVRGRDAAALRVLELLRARVPAERLRLRLGIAHVDCQELAEELGAALEEEYEPDELLVRPAAGVLAAHLGPGAWAVFYQAE